MHAAQFISNPAETINQSVPSHQDERLKNGDGGLNTPAEEKEKKKNLLPSTETARNFVLLSLSLLLL